LADKEPDKGTTVWQDADLLVKFRNAFMHFKPAWDHEEATRDGKLVEVLKTKIPIYRAYKSGAFIFSFGFMTYGCSKWSVASVVS
jgi:hypothetical protein